MERYNHILGRIYKLLPLLAVGIALKVYDIRRPERGPLSTEAAGLVGGVGESSGTVYYSLRLVAL